MELAKNRFLYALNSVFSTKIGLPVEFGTELVGKFRYNKYLLKWGQFYVQNVQNNKYLEEEHRNSQEHVLGEPAVRVRVQLTNLRLSNNFCVFVGFKNVGYNRWFNSIWILMTSFSRFLKFRCRATNDSPK